MYMKMEKLKQDVKNYQLNSNKLYTSYETDKYSPYQNYLYKRALYGLEALDKKELESMCSKKKQRIMNVYKKGQTILNKFKQEVTIKYTNLLFQSLFPNSPITDFFLLNSETDEKFKNTLTFKDLNINKDQLIDVFIKEGVLPKNFLSLTVSPNQLPRLKNEKA
jgi:hypothetical protein